MMVKFENNVLYIGDMKKEFTHNIRDAHIENKKIIVLLDIPYEDKTIDNIYAISNEGEILWRSESLKKLYPEQINLPYEYMSVKNGEIIATDFYGRRYFIDDEKGSIKKRDVVK